MNDNNYAKYQDRILSRINQMEDDGYFKRDSPEDKDLIVNSVFIMVPVQDEAGPNINLGSSFPTIAVIGKQTGRVWYFSLKFLLPDVHKEAFGS